MIRKPFLGALLGLTLLALETGALAGPVKPGLHVDETGTLTRAGQPYRGIGVNYFDAFFQALLNPDNPKYEQGFEMLASYEIPFVRFLGGPFWTPEYKLYLEDKQRYFELFDGIVACAERHGIGLIPSLFWNYHAVPDLVKEPVSAWGNPRSKTIRFMRKYTKEVVTRYRGSPAIWGWEFGNEYNLMADLPNAAQHRPTTAPELGAPPTRSELDDLTHEAIRTAFSEFAKEVRRHDPWRMISTGSGFPRPSAWHQAVELSWKGDTWHQYIDMLIGDNPDPVDTLSAHLYPEGGERFGRPFSPSLLLEASMEAARRSGKPLFVGEFGASNELGADEARAHFNELLDALEETGAPLAAVWVFRLDTDDTSWNLSQASGRLYQLEAIREVNRRLGN